MTPVVRARLLTVVALAVITPLGFALKLYGNRWLANSFGGVLYEVFWCLVVFFFVPRRRAALLIAAGVLVATCGLEFLQLVEHPVLDALRSSFIGRTVLGHRFSWTDMPYYLVGSIAGYGLLLMIATRGVYSLPASGGSRDEERTRENRSTGRTL
ncbi:MAG: DUF2809 domain-containing protein [Phycisphaerales bacterium]